MNNQENDDFSLVISIYLAKILLSYCFGIVRVPPIMKLKPKPFEYISNLFSCICFFQYFFFVFPAEKLK
jgi:hypothetical protein